MKRVALYLSGVHDISGGGGAERFFADFFTIYQNHPNRKFELFFFCDESTFKALQNVDKLKGINNVVLLQVESCPCENGHFCTRLDTRRTRTALGTL